MIRLMVYYLRLKEQEHPEEGREQRFACFVGRKTGSGRTSCEPNYGLVFRSGDRIARFLFKTYICAVPSRVSTALISLVRQTSATIYIRKRTESAIAN